MLRRGGTLFGLPSGDVEDVVRGTIAVVGAKVESVPLTKSAGTGKAPRIIRKVSMEYSGYVPRGGELVELHSKDIIDLGDFGRDELSEVVPLVLLRGGKVLLIGGDHSSTFFALRGAAVVDVLWLDAHLDLGDPSEEVTHGNCLRRLVESGKEASVFGFRGYSSYPGELELAQKLGIKILDSLDGLEGYEAVSLDLDFFDPTELSATGVPELRGYRVSPFLSVLEEGLDAKYFDIVEYAPARDCSLNDARKVVMLIAEILASM